MLHRWPQTERNATRQQQGQEYAASNLMTSSLLVAKVRKPTEQRDTDQKSQHRKHPPNPKPGSAQGTNASITAEHLRAQTLEHSTRQLHPNGQRRIRQKERTHKFYLEQEKKRRGRITRAARDASFRATDRIYRTEIRQKEIERLAARV